MRPRAVLFDAGNTLLLLDYPRLAEGVSRATGVPLSGPGLAAQAGPAARLMERGEGSDRERASRFLEQLFRLAGVPEGRMDLVRDTLLWMHRERHLWGEMDPATPGVLARLRSAGLRLGVISNSDGRIEEALAAVGIRDAFECIIDSQLVGVEKPDPRIFAIALEQLALPPTEAVYVGDIYEVDVVGARRARLEAILLDPHGNHHGRDVPTAANIRAVADLVLGTE